MNINDKEKTNRPSKHHDDKGTTATASQKVREAMSKNAPSWEAPEGMNKHHGDKEADNEKTSPPVNSYHAEEESLREDNTNDGANAEYMDHQDINEINDDDFGQPQSMSEGLSSIYAGRPSTQKEREALVRERLEEINAPGSRKQKLGEDKPKEVKDPMTWKNDSEASLGIARGEIPSGHRDPNFSPARQNYWGEGTIGEAPYGDHDHDDREVRRRQDEGERPWDTTSNFESEYERDEFDERGRKQKSRRRQEEDEVSRHSYKRKDKARARHGDRQQHYTDDNE